MIQQIFGTQEEDLTDGINGGLYGGLCNNNIWEQRTPWFIPGTFRNLVFKNDPLGTWTLYKNNVATTIVSNGNGSDITNSLVVTAADIAGGPIYLHYRRTGSTKLAYVGNPVTSCLEFESADTVTSGYGIKTTLFSSVTTDVAGGPFGGRNWSGVAASPNIESNYYSVISVPGTITSLATLVAFAFAFNAAKGVRIGLVKNGVLQNGAGGTPDTRITTLAAAADTFYGNTSSGWSVSVVVGDRIELFKENIGDLSVEGIYQSIGGFVKFNAASASAGKFIICGSNQTYNLSTAPLYGSVPGRFEPLEDDPGPGGAPFTPIGTTNVGPIVNAISLTGLVTYKTKPSGAGPTLLIEGRVNEATPANAPSLSTTSASADLNIDSNLAHIMLVSPGDVWNIKASSVSLATISTQYHWSFAAYFSLTPAPPGGNGSGGGIYQLVEDKRDDTLYESFTPKILQDYKIP